MSWFRDLFLGNWRNKGVALFFAVTIWFVVFQSEKQEHSANVTVTIAPADPKSMIITSVTHQDEEKREYVEFRKQVKLDFSGPRRQIEELREELGIEPLAFPLKVSSGEEAHAFRAEDFGFPRQGIEIVKFTPESVRVAQEEVDTITVGNLAERIQVTERKEGYDSVTKTVDEPTEVTIRGPKSIVHLVEPRISVSMGWLRERFKGSVPVNLSCPDEIADLVKETVTVSDPQVRVEVVTSASVVSLPEEAVRITFRIPPLDVPIKIVVQELAGDTIPIEFYGPQDRISRLKEELSAPGFALAVRVPSTISFEPGVEENKTFTFTEEEVELYGFPEIRMRPHASRPRRAWTCLVVVGVEPEK